MKKLFPKAGSLRRSIVCASLALAVCATAVSCGDSADDKDKTTYAMLQGTWQSTHIKGHDYFYSSHGESGNWIENFDRDLTGPQDENWTVIRFDRNNMVTIIELDNSEDTSYLPVALRYTFKAPDRLYGEPFSGDFTNYSTIAELTDTRLVLEMDDKGTDEDGTSDYFARITFKKIAE